MSLELELDIPGTHPDGRLFIGWAPIEANLRISSGSNARESHSVSLTNGGRRGKLRFASSRTGDGEDNLDLTLSGSGAPAGFWLAGDFGEPSSDYGDAALEMSDSAGTLVLRRELMVRVRKDATTLSAAERDRFLSALGTLNGRGSGRFSDFRDMHTDEADPEEHGDSGFLPWHRAYLLDLERELQRIDPTVALPYWRFDRPAPAMFSTDFIGTSDGAGRVRFRAGHPLEHWTTDTQPGILRLPQFNTAVAPHRPMSEAQTLLLGGASGDYGFFMSMEGNPHGNAHVSFRGFIGMISTAPRDPLFFMLHANVDRLWAKWQWRYRRHDSALAQSYYDGARVGHRRSDTMWPWNQVTTPPRPSTAPGGAFAPSLETPIPGGSPTVRSMIDYQGISSGLSLAFDYDDVPFEE